MSKELVEVGASLANFGLKEPEGMILPEDDPEEKQVAPEEESGEAEELDASEDEEQDEEESEEESDDDDLKSQLEHKEQVIRKFQSKVDSQEAQMNQMQQQLMAVYQEFQSLKNKEDDEEDEDFDLDDDALVTGRHMKALGKKRKQTAAQLEQFQQYEAQRVQQEQVKLQAQNQWLQSQPDIQEVSDFISKHNLQNDPDISQLQTDNIGLYWAVKAKMLEQKTKGLRKATKAVKKRKSVPPTGGKGGSRSGTPMGQMERQMKALGDKLGLDLSAG